MREIKFRQRMPNGEWHYWGFLETAPGVINYISPSHSELISPEDALEGSDQYTGLLDKNGTEIYEGNIIRMWWGYSPGRGGDIYRNHAIEFSSGEVGPCRGENVMEWKLHDCSNLWDGKDVEVIGNIYESPELLEAKA